jgi:hypothetical protein
MNAPMPAQVSNDRLTPSAVEVLLHYHYQSGLPHPRHDAPAIKDARDAFIQLDVIHPIKLERGCICLDDLTAESKLFHTTARGQNWVEAICRVPCPPS